MTQTIALEQNSILFSPTIAAAIGLNESIALGQVWRCIVNPNMTGTVIEGEKWIKNPVVCQNPRKIARAKEHGKPIDWQGSFKWATPKKIRETFQNLENLGLIKTAQFSKTNYDHTKYYTVVKEKLEELLKALQLPIFPFWGDRISQSSPTALPAPVNSNQGSSSKEYFQDQDHTPNPSVIETTVCVTGIVENLEEEENQEEKPSVRSHRSKSRQERGSARRTEDPLLDQSSAVRVEVEPDCSVGKYDDFYTQVLEYVQQCPSIRNPGGYATSVVDKLSKGDLAPHVKILWKEYCDGVQLGSTGPIPAGFILRDVPAPAVAKAILIDHQSKPGSTATESAAKAAKSLQNHAIVSAVGVIAQRQVERTAEDARRQVELGISPEHALNNCLPGYVKEEYQQQNVLPYSPSPVETIALPAESSDEPSKDEPEKPTARYLATRLTIQFWRAGKNSDALSDAIARLKDLIAEYPDEESTIKAIFMGSTLPNVKSWAEENLGQYLF